MRNEHHDEPVIFEINPRFSGGIPLTVTLTLADAMETLPLALLVSR